MNYSYGSHTVTLVSHIPFASQKNKQDNFKMSVNTKVKKNLSSFPD